VEFIQIGVGKFGETQPCDDTDDAAVKTALAADGGLTEWSWAYIVNDILHIYSDNFHQTKLLLPNAPTFASDTCGRRTWTDEAVARGVGVFPAEMYPIPQWVDHRTHAGWNGCGVLDRILDQAGTDASWVPVAFEGYNYMTPDAITFFWGITAALSRRADYITLERDVLYVGSAADPVVTPLYANIAVMGWASQYLGKHINETPSVWVALRETGYKDSFYPQKGNYSFWLTQDDAVPGGRTVPTTYLQKSEIVIAYHWSTYGESCVNSAVETGQGFLGPSREGWICRRTDQNSGNSYMWLKIDDRYRSAHPGSEATITVTYLDRGNDSWRLQYDSNSGDAYAVAGTVNKTNSGTWKQAVFHVNDARFLKGQTGGADLRIDCMGDGNEYIHMVDVRLGGAAGPTFTPTATRLETNTPTLSPTPSGTPGPSSTPTITLTPSNTPDVTPTPRPIVIKPGKVDSRDTYLSMWEPTSNKSGSTRLYARSQGSVTYRPLLRFDTSVIPTNSRVTKAELHLYLDSYEHSPGVSPRVSAHKVKRDWVASEATWNLARQGEAWQVPGADGSGDRNLAESAATVVSTNDTWYNWDITNLVGEWVSNPASNQGVMLISDAGRELRFYSADDPDTRRIPYLYIEYIEGGGTPTTPTPTGSPTKTPSVEPPPETVDKGASQDTYIDFYNPTTNYEARGFRLYGFGYKRALLNFDVSDLPASARIVSATLRLTTASECAQHQELPLTVGVYQVNRPWVASQATWNLAAIDAPWAVPGGDHIPADRSATASGVATVREVSGSHPWEVKSYTWDVTSIVQSWIDSPSGQAGLVVMSLDPTYREVCFRDSAYSLAEHRPVLHIEWRRAPAPTSTPTPQTPTPTNTPFGGATPTPTATSTFGAVEGIVFDDLNTNGRRDAGELGLAGAVVELWQGSTLVGRQNTPGSGLYGFIGLSVGTYTVKEIDPAGFLSSPGSPNEVSGVLAVAGRTTVVDFADYDPRVVTPPKYLHLPIIFK
jgi:hypothetical protein